MTITTLNGGGEGDNFYVPLDGRLWPRNYKTGESVSTALFEVVDVLSNSPFFTSKYKAIWKENPVVNQMPLGASLHVPLHLILIIMILHSYKQKSSTVETLRLQISTCMTYVCAIYNSLWWSQNLEFSPSINYLLIQPPLSFQKKISEFWIKSDLV